MKSWIAQIEPGQTPSLFEHLAGARISQVLILAVILSIVRFGMVGALAQIRKSQSSSPWEGLIGLCANLADSVTFAAVLVFFIIRPFAFQTFYIPSGSMIDTLRVGDMIVADKWTYRHSDPVAGDVAVFKPPASALGNSPPETEFIKRVIGTPGQVIEIKQNKLFRNKKPVDEPYVDYTYPDRQYTRLMPRERWNSVRIPDFKLIKENGKYLTLSNIGGFLSTGQHPDGRQEAVEDAIIYERYLKAPAVPIPPGFYLMMGDNRNGSYDGRFWGLVPRNQIIGKGWFVWLPLGRWHRL